MNTPEKFVIKRNFEYLYLTNRIDLSYSFGELEFAEQLTFEQALYWLDVLSKEYADDICVLPYNQRLKYSDFLENYGFAVISCLTIIIFCAAGILSILL